MSLICRNQWAILAVIKEKTSKIPGFNYDCGRSSYKHSGTLMGYTMDNKHTNWM